MTKYRVVITQMLSEETIVTAKTAVEARKKAWENWNPKKKNYSIETEREPNNYVFVK